MKITIYITLLLGLFGDTTAMNQETIAQENSTAFKNFILNTVREESNDKIFLNEIKTKIDKVSLHTANLLKEHHLSTVSSNPKLSPFSNSEKYFLVGSKISSQDNNKKEDYPFDHILTIIPIKSKIKFFTLFASLNVLLKPLKKNGICLQGKLPTPIFNRIAEQAELVPKIAMYKIRPHPQIGDYGRNISSISIDKNDNIRIFFEIKQGTQVQKNVIFDYMKSLMIISQKNNTCEVYRDIDTKIEDGCEIPLINQKNSFTFYYRNRNSFDYRMRGPIRPEDPFIYPQDTHPYYPNHQLIKPFFIDGTPLYIDDISPIYVEHLSRLDFSKHPVIMERIN